MTKGQKTWSKTATGLKKATNLIEYAIHIFPVLGSKTAAIKAIKTGRLSLNGNPARMDHLVKNGDLLKLQGLGLQKARPFNIDLDIVYEDDYLLVVNKPAGIAVNGSRNKTIENAVAGIQNKSTIQDQLPRPIAVHRIDVPTKGLVILAKTKSALIQLSKDFQQKRIQKEYFAVVHGQPPVTGRIDFPVDGKKAITELNTEMTVQSRVFKYLSLVRLCPVTGRTHQLRIHLQKKGHLIVGDKLYSGKQKTILGKGLFLCACRLVLQHPVSGKQLDVQIDPPSRFIKLLEREQQRFH